MYVVGQDDGRLLLIGRIHVAGVVDQEPAERLLGQELYDAPDHVMGAPPWTQARFDRVVPEAIARDLTMQGGARLVFASDSQYRLAGQALRADRWLSARSAAALDQLLDADTLVDDEQQLIEDVVRGRRRGGERLTAAGRRAVERHAMVRAVAWLRSEGWEVTDTSATRPYDLVAARGDQRRYVEVKGTTGDGSSVPLTAGEVDHARAHTQESMLVVVSDVELEHGREDQPKASGGRLRYTAPWAPTDDDLRQIAFVHTPPALRDAISPARRAPTDDWDAFVAAVAAARQRSISTGDFAWRSVSEALHRDGWDVAPYQSGGASGAVLRRAINAAFARGLVPDDNSLVKRRRRE